MKDITCTVTLPAAERRRWDPMTRQETFTAIPGCTVEITISGYGLVALAERAQRSKGRRARFGPAQARARFRASER